jgi:hypothetical protein
MKRVSILSPSRNDEPFLANKMVQHDDFPEFHKIKRFYSILRTFREYRGNGMSASFISMFMDVERI